jgi:hypothetical protein
MRFASQWKLIDFSHFNKKVCPQHLCRELRRQRSEMALSQAFGEKRVALHPHSTGLTIIFEAHDGGGSGDQRQ